MDMAFFLKSIWLFLLGVVVAIIGLYCLVFRPDMGSNPFTIMLIGLFFTGAGSIYGKRKLREGESMVSAPPEQRPLGYPSQPQQPQQPPQEYPRYPREAYVEAREVPAEQRIPSEQREPPSEALLEVAEEAIDTKPPEPVRRPVRPVPSIPSEPVAEPAAEPVAEPAVEKPEIPEKPIAEIPAKPKEAKILKIVVCPKCGAENEAKDKFCYNCGEKLKLEKKKRKRPKKTKKVKLHIKAPHKVVVKPRAKKKRAKKVKKKPAEKPAGILEAAETI